jgi:hypothetical protein
LMLLGNTCKPRACIHIRLISPEGLHRVAGAPRGWATDEFPAAELQKQKFDLVNYVQLHGYASQLRVLKR